MNHYPFNPSDYAMATAHLEPLHDLCYRRCIDLYMDQEGPLVANAKRTLSKRLRVNEDVLSEVLEEFFFETDDGWHHKRCDSEIARYQAKSEKAKKAGSLGGMAKKAAPEANAKRSLSKRLANASNQNQNQNQNQVHTPKPLAASAPPPLVCPQKLEVGSWFGRRASTPWSRKECKSWDQIPSDFLAEGIEILKAPYSAKEKFCRRDLLTLLNNWQGECDRWRSYRPALRSDVQAIEDEGELGFLSNDDAIFHKDKP